MRLVSGTYTHQIEEKGKTYVVTTGTYEIDPTSAQRLLNTTGKQRPIYKANVRKITRAHINKLWKYLGDTIKLDQYGNLLDGAHRLQAAIDAGVTIIVMIVSGLPAQYFEYMDTSKSRGIKDALTIHGVKNAEVTRQVLTFLWQLGNTSNPKEIPTPPEAVLLFNKFGDLHTNALSAHVARGTKGKLAHFNGGAVGVLSYIYRTTNPDKEALFWKGVLEGLDIQSPDDPRKVLRDYVNEMTRARTRADYRISAMDCAVWIHYAWKNWLAGKGLKSFQVDIKTAEITSELHAIGASLLEDQGYLLAANEG